MAILKDKKVGDVVNLENDIIGKYVERLLNFKETEEKKSESSSNLTMEFLEKYGI